MHQTWLKSAQLRKSLMQEHSRQAGIVFLHNQLRWVYMLVMLSQISMGQQQQHQQQQTLHTLYHYGQGHMLKQ